MVSHDRLSFRINSSTKEDVIHLVDLEANLGHGECSCENFVYRISPAIAKAKKEKTFTRFDPNLMCKHICQARNTLINLLLTNTVIKKK